MDNANNLCARLVLGIMLNVIINCSLGIYESQNFSNIRFIEKSIILKTPMYNPSDKLHLQLN